MEVLQGQRAEHARLRVTAHSLDVWTVPPSLRTRGNSRRSACSDGVANQVTGWSPAGEVSAARELDNPTADGNDV